MKITAISKINNCTSKFIRIASAFILASLFLMVVNAQTANNSCISLGDNPYTITGQTTATLNYKSGSFSICSVNYGNSVDHLDFESAQTNGTSHRVDLDLSKVNLWQDVYFQINCELNNGSTIMQGCLFDGTIPASAMNVNSTNVPAATFTSLTLKEIEIISIPLILAILLLELSYAGWLRYFFSKITNRKNNIRGFIFSPNDGEPLVCQKINFLDPLTKKIIAKSMSDRHGHFSIKSAIMNKNRVIITVNRRGFNMVEITIDPADFKDEFVRVPMYRKRPANLAESLSKFLQKRAPILLIVYNFCGSLLAAYYSYPSKDFLGLTICAFYFLLTILCGLRFIMKPKSVGQIINSSSALPLHGAIVELYSLNSMMPVRITISDNHGYFNFGSTKGDYLLHAELDNYRFPSLLNNGIIVESENQRRFVQIFIAPKKFYKIGLDWVN